MRLCVGCALVDGCGGLAGDFRRKKSDGWSVLMRYFGRGNGIICDH